jgi:PKD repeat protein
MMVTNPEIIKQDMKTNFYVYLYSLLLIVTVFACEDDETTSPQPAAAFTASAVNAKIGEEIIFTNTSENATAFRWSFGDGTTSKEISPKKSYSSSGTYTVSLLSTGEGGSTISSQNITILPDPELYFIEVDASLIRKFGISGADDVSDFLDITGMAGVGLAYDSTADKIYFSDYNVYGEGKIWRINRDGTDLEEIVSGLFDPYQIAVDVAGGKIYWAEDTDELDMGHIARANLDGSGKENVVTLEGGQFRAIALDQENNRMYYYDVNNEDLYRANLDGTDAVSILPGVYGYAIQVDTVNDKIYFDEQNEGVLKMADLDGGNLETVDDNGTRIYGITIDYATGKLYWAGRDSGEIYQANLDGTHKIVLKGALSSPRGIFFKK